MEEVRDRAEWNKRIARMKREQKKARMRQRLLLIVGVLVICAVILSVMMIRIGHKDTVNDVSDGSGVTADASAEGQGIRIDVSGRAGDGILLQDDNDISASVSEYDDKVGTDNLTESHVNNKTYSYTEADNLEYLVSDNMTSAHAILVDVDNGLITGAVDHKARIYPASMTKIMTLLVAVENTTDFKKKVSVSQDATNYAYSKKLSAVNFDIGEEVTIEDLCYGTILPSGADAAAELAIQTAGSMDAFVDMMNEKAKALGISGTTHFANVSGSHDENNYSTCYDIAIIMNAAMDNEYCRKVLSEHRYTTSASAEHPDGIEISNWFLRRIEDKDTGGEVIGAKTGFVVESRNCAASYYTSASGRNYIAVTVNAHSAWRCIYDHVDIYKNHTK